MYGDGLRRIVETIEAAREAGDTILDELAQDGVVASLLLIHDLYPVSLEERVLEALDTVRPYMESHGGNVQLLAIDDGVARLALEGSCNGCAASRATLELAIKQALDEHAPDLVGLEVEGVVEPAVNGEALPMVQAPETGPELPMVHVGEIPPPVAQERLPRWVGLQDRPGSGEVRAVTVEGVALVLANVDGSLLAYRDACAACGEPLHDGELIGHMLRCRVLRGRVRPARGPAGPPGGEPLQLAPVPLLQEGGVRVAV